MKTEDVVLSILETEKEASSAYPKDLGSWGVESDKIEELKRHLRRFKVELKGTYITKHEFPVLVKKYPPGKQEIEENKNLKGEDPIESSLLEIELKSNVADEPKVMKVLKALKAFPMEHHHITNLRKKDLEIDEEFFEKQSEEPI